MNRFSPSSVDDALNQARRYIQVRYVIFLASLLVVFALTAIAGGVFAVSLLNDSDWKQSAISGGVAAFMVLILILLQYRPARSFGSAATQVAQLEATRSSLNKSIEFWDRFLDERQQARELTANDIAMAVTSMTTASRELIDAEIDVEVGRSAKAQAAKAEQGSSDKSRSRTMPDPRRY